MGITAEVSWELLAACQTLRGNGMPALLPGSGFGTAVGKHLSLSFLSVFVQLRCPQALLRLQEPFKASLLKEQQIVFQCGYLIAESPFPLI